MSLIRCPQLTPTSPLPCFVQQKKNPGGQQKKNTKKNPVAQQKKKTQSYVQQKKTPVTTPSPLQTEKQRSIELVAVVGATTPTHCRTRTRSLTQLWRAYAHVCMYVHAASMRTCVPAVAQEHGHPAYNIYIYIRCIIYIIIIFYILYYCRHMYSSILICFYCFILPNHCCCMHEQIKSNCCM